MGVVADAVANESRGFKHMASEPPKPSPGFQLGGTHFPSCPNPDLIPRCWLSKISGIANIGKDLVTKMLHFTGRIHRKREKSWDSSMQDVLRLHYSVGEKFKSY
jgi:hypothetical protein